jgi:hypothetical protein
MLRSLALERPAAAGVPAGTPSRRRCFAQRQLCGLAGQSHSISPEATAPILADFLAT